MKVLVGLVDLLDPLDPADLLDLLHPVDLLDLLHPVDPADQAVQEGWADHSLSLLDH